MRPSSMALVTVGNELQKLGRRLKTLLRIFLEKHFDEADNRLRNAFEFRERQGSVLMLSHNSGEQYPEMAHDPSASAKAKHPVSRDPNGYPPLLLKFVPDWRTLVFPQRPHLPRSWFEHQTHRPPSPNRDR